MHQTTDFIKGFFARSPRKPLPKKRKAPMETAAGAAAPTVLVLCSSPWTLGSHLLYGSAGLLPGGETSVKMCDVGVAQLPERVGSKRRASARGTVQDDAPGRIKLVQESLACFCLARPGKYTPQKKKKPRQGLLPLAYRGQ